MPRLQTYTSSVTAAISGQVCTAMCDSASSTTPVMPTGVVRLAPGAAAKRWNNSPTALRPAARTAARHSVRNASGSVITGRATGQSRRSAVRCNPCIG